MIQIYLNLIKLLIFALLLHLKCLHFTFDNIAYFQVERHVIVVDAVQDYWVWDDRPRTIVITAFSHLLNIFLDVVLNNLNSLYNNILEYSLSLFKVELGLICVFIKPCIEFLLKLEIHFVLAIDDAVHVAEARTRSQRMLTMFIDWGISELINSTSFRPCQGRIVIHDISAWRLRSAGLNEVIVHGSTLDSWWNAFAGQIVLGRGSWPVKVMGIQIYFILTSKNIAHRLLVNKGGVVELGLAKLGRIHIICKSVWLRHITSVSHRVVSVIWRLGETHVLEQTLRTHLVQKHRLFIRILPIYTLFHIQIILSFLDDCL